MKNQDLNSVDSLTETDKKVDKTDKAVLKVLKSIAQLFQPFKDVLINVLPASKSLIRILDFIGNSIAKLILLVAALIPIFLNFLKGKIFKLIILLIVVLIVINTITSRIMNTTNYKNMLATAIEEAIGYRTIIEGRVGVNLLLFSVNINNAAFYSPINKNSEFSLNFLSVNSLKIKFSFLSLLTGKLKAKKVSVNKAEIRYKFVSAYNGEDKFLSLTNELNEITNIRMIPTEKVSYTNRVSDSAKFITDLNNLNVNSSFFNKNKDSSISDDKLQNDNYKKYINLKDVFVDKDNSNVPVFFNVDNSNLFYKLLYGISKQLKFDLAGLNNLTFANVTFKLVDYSNKPIITIDNLIGNLNRSFLGKHFLEGEGRFLTKDMFFSFKSWNTKGGKEFDLMLSYENNNFKSKDIIISGIINTNNKIDGNIALSGKALKNLFTQTSFKNDFLNIQDSYLNSSFSYKDSILSVSNSDLTINKDKHNLSLLYNFSGNGIVELNLNLNLKDSNILFDSFKEYRKNKQGSVFSIFNDLLLQWHSSKNSILNPKIFAINLQINNSNLNNAPLSNFILDGFLDNNDNFYINKLYLQGENFNTEARGKIQLVNKNGIMLLNSKGGLQNLCSYASCSENFKQFIRTISGDQDEYAFNAKMFLTDDRLVFNDINGNIGQKSIYNTSATLIERNNASDLIISSKLDNIDFMDLYKIYNFNKKVGRLYYNDSNQITGIPDNLTVYLNLYSNNLKFKDLNFVNFEMESSIISSGILVHNFSFNDVAGTGSIRGAFNFNDKVTPSIVGNIAFTNILIQAEELHNIIFNNYKITGKVIINGNINISGDNYYNGVNKVNGNLSLTKYERLKINKENKTPGFYLTLIKMLYQGEDYYQIGDLYANINISNNLLNLSPSVIRYINGTESYRGSLSGSFDVLKDEINLRAILDHENNKSSIDSIIKGTLLDMSVK